MSSVKWVVDGEDYTGAITEDGEEHVASLTGLPEGVTVTYSNETGTDTGSYTTTATIATYDSSNYNKPSLGDKATFSWEITA